MKFDYGCIGEVLGHSFSKEIHSELADYDYSLVEIARENLENFATQKEFKAINVTIPYKEMIMPYMYEVDDNAQSIGAVNTVVNRGGRLYGYNTDFNGMKSLILHLDIDLCDKKVVILGTGGTSKTAYAVSKSLGAREIYKVSRNKKESAITYEDLYRDHTDAEVIINTTPCGMFPSIFDSPIDISRFDSLCGVIDVIYNPIRTPLILAAKKRGIKAEGGLYMLVSQAVHASEIFTDTVYPESETERIYRKIAKEKENIVLIGMPASGKSTVGKILADIMQREFVDTDTLVAENEGKSIPEIFNTSGEKYFRDAETEAIKSISHLTGKIIATGGGAVLREENVDALRENGRIYFIDRPLSDLIPTSDRPLSKTKEDIEKRYHERYFIYTSSADKTIFADLDAENVAKRIMEDFCK